VVLVALWRPAIRGLGGATLRDVVLFGVALAGMNLCFYAAIDRIPLGIGVALEFVGPLGVAIAGSRRGLDVVWVVLAAAGIALLTPDIGGSLDPLGVALALAAGGFWAGYIVFSQRVGSALDGGDGLALAMCVAALIALPPGLADAGDALLEPDLLAAGFAVAMLSSVIAYSLELEALRRLPRRTFGVLMSLEPGMAALLGFVLLSQALAASEVLAIALVVAASAGALAGAGADVPEA
jgi:inner membrane transporter RhtA